MFYKSIRIGLAGKPFTMWKIKTLRDGSSVSSFASNDAYLPLGAFLRRIKADELPAVWNVLKRDLNVFGYRPDEPRTWQIYPQHIKELLAKEKPGLIDLASLHFFSEEKILQLGDDPSREYWEKVFPIKMALRAFYFENKCWLLNLAILWIAFKKIVKSLFK